MPPGLGRYEILGVMGPDEYHDYHDAYPGADRPGLDNNTDTNVMVVWTLLRALEALDVLPPPTARRSSRSCSRARRSCRRWRDITRKMKVVFRRDGTTAEGIHLGAMAGTVDTVLRCLTGMRARGQVLRFEPALPTEIKQLRFSVHCRGHRIEVTLAEDRLEVRSRPGTAAPITVLVGTETVPLETGGGARVHPRTAPVKRSPCSAAPRQDGQRARHVRGPARN